VDDVEASAPWVSNLHFASAIVGSAGADPNGSLGIGRSDEYSQKEAERERGDIEEIEVVQEVPPIAAIEEVARE